MIVIVKIGSSSLTGPSGHLRNDVVQKLCDEVFELRKSDHRAIIVSSGAVAAGLPALGFDGARPRDARTLQAASAVGQSRLMALYEKALERHGLVAGQMLLAPFDFFERSQYLHARGTLNRLLELGVVPVVNENDAVADDAIRFGDNDRIAALVAHLIQADRLILLTDTAGLLSGDPRDDSDASLVEEVRSFETDIPAVIGGAGSDRGSGGMTSKVAAAKMAAVSGVTTVIAAADRPRVIRDAIAESPGVGTIVRPKIRRLSAKKLWIGFAVEPVGTVVVDEGARRALEGGGASLLAVGVRDWVGKFERNDPIEISTESGIAFARGLAAVSCKELEAISGIRSSQHPSGTPDEVVHRDELVLLY